MGTRLDALLFGADQSFLLTTWNKVVAELERLQQMLDKFNPDSELSLLSKNAVRNPAGMSEELWNILLDSKRYHKLTLGYFDITLSDFQGIEFDYDGHTVCFRGKSLSLDLGGYAKGYAMLKVRKMLVSLGIMQAFINFGNSSVMALGKHPAGKSWLVGIDNPFIPGQVLGSVELCDNSLSTSGNLPHHNRHIINPVSGEFYTGKKVVSVVADNDLEAEILSTALLLADDDVAEQIKENFKNLTVYTFKIP
jgi:thiamine biosynthesis lipoprotein